MSTTIRSTITAVSLSAVVAVTALAGFAIANDDTATAVSVTDTKAGSTAPPGPTAPAFSAEGALLGTAQMPRVNEVQTWSAVNSKASFVGFGNDDLGATETARRDFQMSGGHAANVVFTFAGEASAKMAFGDIVESSKADLKAGLPASGELLYGPGERVALKVADGQAAFSSIIYKDDPAGEEGWFEWVGAVQRGDTVAVVAWRIGGNDASYDIDPTIAALQAAHTALAR